MEKFQKFQDQLQSTNEIVGQGSTATRKEGKLSRIRKKINEAWLVLKGYAKKHESKIYLVVTLLAIIYAFFSYGYYQSELVCKYEKDQDCMTYLLGPAGNKVANFVLFLLTDCFVLMFFLYCFILKKTYRILIALGIIQHILLFYTGQFQMSVHNMTGMIKAGHYPFLIISAALFLAVISYKRCLKKSAVYSIAGLIIFCLIFYILIWRNQCYYWKMGINGEIQDRQGSCRLKAPLCIYLQTVSRVDLNYFFHNCFLGEQYRKYFDKHFSYDIGNGTIVGFSDLKEATEMERTHRNFINTVFKRASRYRTIEEAQETKKHDVIFDTVEQRYHIDMIYNHTLAQEKAEIRRKFEASSSPPLAKNVLLIFLDSVSRFQTHLKLPKMVSWFEKQAKYKSYLPVEPIQQQLSQSKSEAYEFYKYHALGYTTAHNLFPMFYGHHLDHMKNVNDVMKENFTKFPSIHKDFSDRGFITSFSSSFCASYGADIYEGDVAAVVNPKADHQSYSFNCDPNFIEPYLQFGYSKGIGATTDRCLYRKTEAEYAFQYASDFFDKYENSSKFSQINLIEGHDFFGGSVRFVDNAITSFLEQMQSKGYLNDTLVIVVSDHGQHQGNSFKSISSDHYNPFLYLAVPQEMNRQFRESIRLNQQDLITAFNIYHFLMHVAVGQAYPKKDLGLMADMSFQTNCTVANITYPTQKCFCYDS